MSTAAKTYDEKMELTDILESLSVLNRDNGKIFTNDERLKVIASLLEDSGYSKVNKAGLFHLYGLKPVRDYRGNRTIVVSSHVDCQKAISRCFSTLLGDNLMKGTYDNSITNAAILSLMLSGSLSRDVLIAFTGDEEEDSRGAGQLVKYLKGENIVIGHLFVLDVTDMGWGEQADYTIENNFWRDDFGRKIIDCTGKLSYSWKFVPSDPFRIPSFVPESAVIPFEAEADESWLYDDENINCCSICLPVNGDMHSNEGVLARRSSFFHYRDALGEILKVR